MGSDLHFGIATSAAYGESERKLRERIKELEAKVADLESKLADRNAYAERWDAMKGDTIAVDRGELRELRADQDEIRKIREWAKKVIASMAPSDAGKWFRLEEGDGEE